VEGILEMWDFDDDEWIFLAVAFAAVIFLGARYFKHLLLVSPMVSPRSTRSMLLITPPICVAFTYCILANWSDPQTVRGHADYMTLFMVGAALWVFASPSFLVLGVHLRDDAVERKNIAAGIVLSAAMIANTLCCAGSNIGSGPTIWTTLGPAAVATGTLLALWAFIRIFSGVVEVIAIERNVPSACVVATALLAIGANLGWAMSGDWQDWNSTLKDFGNRAWPSLIISFAAILILRIIRPKTFLQR
jgi:hypothetical protein